MSEIWLPARVKQDLKPKRIRVHRTRPTRRSFAGGWEGAKPHGDLEAFSRAPVPINQELLSFLQPLRARSRVLAKNDGYVKRFLGLAQSNVVGPYGFTFKSTVKSAGGKPQMGIKKAVERGWKEFSKPGVCCSRNRLSMRDFYNLIVMQLLRDGEVLAVRRDGPDESKFGISYQFVDPELLPIEYNDDRNGRRIRMGIELDNRDRRVAYYFRGFSVDGPSYYSQNQRDLIRVPADKVIHEFLVHDPDQLRGVPAIAAAMLRARRIGGYEDAEVIAKRISSSKMGIITPGDDNKGFDGDDSIVVEGADEEEFEVDVYEEDAIELEPGTFQYLARNANIETFDPQHHGDFDSFMKRMLRGLASGLGISYHSLASDLEGVNYSSMRGGIQEDREIWMGLQEWVIEHVLDPIFDSWLEMSLLSEALTLVNGKPLKSATVDKYQSHRFQGRRWPWVDPLKDIQAAERSFSLRITSLSKLIRDAGEDPEQIWEELASDRDRLEELGIPINLNLASKPTTDDPKTDEDDDEGKTDE